MKGKNIPFHILHHIPKLFENHLIDLLFPYLSNSTVMCISNQSENNCCLYFALFFPKAKAGFVLNIIGILCINLAINTWGTLMFQLDTFPTWINTTAKP